MNDAREINEETEKIENKEEAKEINNETKKKKINENKEINNKIEEKETEDKCEKEITESNEENVNNSIKHLVWKLIRCTTCKSIHNRDSNATKNMLIIVKELLRGKERPEPYKRPSWRPLRI